jgi:hypothetical protein
LHQELISSPQLSALEEAVDELPQFWHGLIGFDPGLRQVPGGKYLVDLKRWVKDGGPFPNHQSNAPNHYGLTVTVLLQIIQYSRYLDQLGKDAHRKVLNSVKVGGIQGFCVGFVSAVAVASPKSEAEIGPSAATALCVAVCVGAYVDLDGIYSSAATVYVAVAIRWREGDAEKVAKLIWPIPNVSGAIILYLGGKHTWNGELTSSSTRPTFPASMTRRV